MKPLGNGAFERLFEAHAEPLFAFLVYRTGDRQLAEDLVADTFERAMRSSSRFDPRRGSEKNWLYAVAVNLTRDNARRASVETRALERVGAQTRDCDDDQRISAVGDRDAIDRALVTLKDDEREAIALRFGSDLKLREVARAVGESESAVEKRISRALEKLQHQLQPPE
jgi:RNA polymerase sigma factor (sigma-70 family)